VNKKQFIKNYSLLSGEKLNCEVMNSFLGIPSSIEL